MKPLPCFRAAFFATVLVPFSALATVYVVDPGGGGDFEVIQLALAEAAPGDTVLVVPGTYTGDQNKNLDFGGDDLVLRSQGGPGVTIIDGEGTGGGIVFQNGETAAAEVRGFTFTRLPDGSPIRVVGGAAPTIRDCVVQGNDVIGDGGGAYVALSTPFFADCVIAENSCTGSGGGVHVNGGAPTFHRCLVVGNRAGAGGGGFRLAAGAMPTIFRGTITGNRAQIGSDGGGIMALGGSFVSLGWTIVWGNRAADGDDLFAGAMSGVAVTCSDVDSSGASGAGTIDYGPTTIFTDPHFCQPLWCLDEPWTRGLYTLAANSPCLPANSPCGQLIGALGEGCDPVVVWTGAGGSTAWEDPANWSTLSLPGHGDVAQLTGGDVTLSTEVEIRGFIQCPEDFGPPPSVFTIADGGLLGMGYEDDPEKVIIVAIVQADKTVTETGGGTIMVKEPPDDWKLPPGACTIMNGGSLLGIGNILCEGCFQFTGLGPGTVGLDLVNLADGSGNPASGVYIQGGMLDVTGSISGPGPLEIAEGAVLNLTGLLELPLAVGGGGSIFSTGLVQRSGPGVSTVLPNLVNGFDTAQGERGTVLLQSGGLELVSLTSSGRVAVANEAQLAVTDALTLEFHNVLAGAGTVDAAQAAFLNQGVVSPGFSPGALAFVGDYDPDPVSRLFIEIGGTEAGTGYDQLNVTGEVTLDGALHVQLVNGFTPQPGDEFRVLTYTQAPALDDTFECVSGLQLPGGLYLDPEITGDALVLVARDTMVNNQPPIAVDDSFTVHIDTPTVLDVLANDDPVDGDDLAVVRLDRHGTQGTVFVDAGSATVSYLPPAGYLGPDAFTYFVTDCAGGLDSALVEVEVADLSSVDPPPLLPAAVALHPPAPNPFNPTTRLRFDLPRAGRVTLAIYDLRGRQVRTLAVGYHDAGTHTVTWRGRDDAGRAVASGVYFARLETPRHADWRKLVLVR